MTAILDNELVQIISVDGDDFNIKISYIDSNSNLKTKQKKVDHTRELTIATNVVI